MVMERERHQSLVERLLSFRVRVKRPFLVKGYVLGIPKNLLAVTFRKRILQTGFVTFNPITNYLVFVERLKSNLKKSVEVFNGVRFFV